MEQSKEEPRRGGKSVPVSHTQGEPGTYTTWRTSQARGCSREAGREREGQRSEQEWRLGALATASTPSLTRAKHLQCARLAPKALDVSLTRSPQQPLSLVHYFLNSPSDEAKDQRLSDVPIVTQLGAGSAPVQSRPAVPAWNLTCAPS